MLKKKINLLPSVIYREVPVESEPEVYFVNISKGVRGLRYTNIFSGDFIKKNIAEKAVGFSQSAVDRIASALTFRKKK